VPNKPVDVINTSTNESKHALSGNDGRFTPDGLTPGNYRVTVETTGFKRTTQQDVAIAANGSPIHITLEPGSPAETVDISAEAPVTQTQTGRSEVRSRPARFRDLPVIDRNNEQLTQLESGITPPTPALDLVTDPERNRFFSTNGQAATVNMFSVDGAMNWEPFRGSEIRVAPVA
jgi:hypothetical protein